MFGVLCGVDWLPCIRLNRNMATFVDRLGTLAKSQRGAYAVACVQRHENRPMQRDQATEPHHKR